MSLRRAKRTKLKKEEKVYRCEECAYVEIEKAHHTLSLMGTPTLGRCPFYTNRKYCVLLSQLSCEQFKMKK